MNQTELAKFFIKRKLSNSPLLNYFLSKPQVNLACGGAIESIKGVSAFEGERCVSSIPWFLLLALITFAAISQHVKDLDTIYH